MCSAPDVKMPENKDVKPEYLRNPYLDGAIGQSNTVNALRLGRSSLRIDPGSPRLALPSIGSPTGQTPGTSPAGYTPSGLPQAGPDPAFGPPISNQVRPTRRQFYQPLGIRADRLPGSTPTYRNVY